MRSDGHCIGAVVIVVAGLSTFMFSDMHSATALQFRVWGSPRKHRSLAMTSSTSDTEVKIAMSHIASIRCQNFAGSTGQDGGELQVDLSSVEIDGETPKPNLVVVTGETGHGKSLLFSKMFELVSGGKASPSLIQNPTPGTPAFVEVSLKLCNLEHVRMAQQRIQAVGLNADEILGPREIPELPVTLTLKRSFTFSSASVKAGLKSICQINKKQVPLKALKAIGAPLLSVVNAPLAASALGRPRSRMAMIDAGVPSEILQKVSELTKRYKRRRSERELLQNDLETRTVMVSMTGDDDRDEELLRHWIYELDAFETRVMELTTSLSTDCTDVESEIGMLLDEMETLDWMSVEDSKVGFCSRVYTALLDLDEQLKGLDRKNEQARASLDFIGSSSSPNSARTALERARQALMDVGGGHSGEKSKVSLATERVHELFNEIDKALSDCVDFLDDEDFGLLAAVKNERNLCAISSEALAECILEWKSFARKHGISPYLLPLCHRSLRQELDGNVEAKVLLPDAIAAEEEALVALRDGCDELRSLRRQIAKKLSVSVSARLPSLGMHSRFLIRIQAAHSRRGGSVIGSDEVDFFLVHDGSKQMGGVVEGHHERRGRLEAVASAGEKARLILAIECEVPGSIGALCGSAALTDQASYTDDAESLIYKRPVAIIYDEIDAHVGGLASVSIAHMLSQQSQACQVVSITHSASVAATADIHVRVKRMGGDGHGVISANPVTGEARLKELARMASGDMAVEEAEAFAGALLRDARERNRQ